MPRLGQASSSTRQELAAWLMILAEPFRSDYATDIANIQGKTIALMKEAARMKEKEARGEKVNKQNAAAVANLRPVGVTPPQQQQKSGHGGSTPQHSSTTLGWLTPLRSSTLISTAGK